MPIGFSTHEEPSNLDSIRIAFGKGALLFEKHVAVPTERYAANAYSATPQEARKWLEAAADAQIMCGTKGKRRPIRERELADIEPLYRGVFAARAIKKGEKITEKDCFTAMPNVHGQLLARQLSKYSEYYANTDFAPKSPLMLESLVLKCTASQRAPDRR